MQISDMKKTLFGFKPEDVYSCFDELSKDFSEKLKSSTVEQEKRIAELEAENASIKEALSLLQDENKKLKNNEAVVGNALIDAKAYAERLRLETEAQAGAQRQRLKEEFIAGKRLAEEVYRNVAVCKQAVIAQLENMKDALDTTEIRVQTAIEEEAIRIDYIDKLRNSESLSLFTLNKGE